MRCDIVQHKRTHSKQCKVLFKLEELLINTRWRHVNNNNDVKSTNFVQKTWPCLQIFWRKGGQWMQRAPPPYNPALCVSAHPPEQTTDHTLSISPFLSLLTSSLIKVSGWAQPAGCWECAPHPMGPIFSLSSLIYRTQRPVALNAGAP